MDLPGSGSQGNNTGPPGPNRPSGGKIPQIPPSWKFAFWYVPLVLLLLWLGLGAFVRMNVRTIPYNEFKNYVHQKQVIECILREDTIEGRIRLPTNAAPTHAGGQPATEEFVFRTYRVEDPKITDELQ